MRQQLGHAGAQDLAAGETDTGRPAEPARSSNTWRAWPLSPSSPRHAAQGQRPALLGPTANPAAELCQQPRGARRMHISWPVVQVAERLVGALTSAPPCAKVERKVGKPTRSQLTQPPSGLSTITREHLNEVTRGHAFAAHCVSPGTPPPSWTAHGRDHTLDHRTTRARTSTTTLVVAGWPPWFEPRAAQPRSH